MNALAVPLDATEFPEPNVANELLWIALPYVCVAILIVGLVWRYRYDQFGWTTRSSQLYEKRLLRIASPLFHFGFLAVIAGHILGLMIPESWTEAIGISEHTYHQLTVPLSLTAGAATVVGLALLIYRRRTVTRVLERTSVSDKLMYVFLGLTILLGVLVSWYASGIFGEGHNYRADVAVWFRSILMFQPQPEAMAAAPMIFQLHVVAGFLMFALWPFTRLVHVFSAPIQYLARPYIVYRKRESHPTGSRAPRRGWEPSRRD
ncbi:respiratory nitrate reductase subunit gamma [Demequina sp.]|uniref:respiratory nitrate reductase subunit gamma n=1 Tax=Demequina sp. TaxID=2050685 RepID=UPI003A851EBA